MMPKDRLRQLTGDERLGQERDSEYLGAEDIDEGTEPILTIAGLWNGMVTLQRGKEKKDVLTFAEERVQGIRQVRPLIVNATNRKTLRKLYGDAKASTLTGKPIQLYIDHNVRDPNDGGKTDGIRIKSYKPRPKQTVPPCSLCGKAIEGVRGRSAEWMANYTAQKYGAPLCAACAQKRAEALKREEEPENVADEEPAGGDGEELL